MKKKTWMTCLVTLLVSCVSVYILLALYWFPYTRFKSESLAAVPKFDALNQAVLDDLPLPKGAVETEKYSLGIKEPEDGSYYRQLNVYYFVSDATGVLDVYRNYFVNHNWELGGEDSSGIGYHLRTACVGVTFPSSDEPNKYLVAIEHDFLNQDFSPKIPQLPNIDGINLLQIYEGFEFSVGTCPYRELNLFKRP